MSTYYNIYLIVGIPVKEFVSSELVELPETRYDELTGKPYKKSIWVRKLLVNGVYYKPEYCLPPELEKEEEKNDFQKAVESLFPGCSYIYEFGYEDEGYIGIPVGKNIDKGCNIYSSDNITELDLILAFDKFQNIAPQHTPMLHSILLTS